MLYDPEKDLGPYIFDLDGVPCGRIDFKVVNQRKQTILCSLYHRTISSDKVWDRSFCSH